MKEQLEDRKMMVSVKHKDFTREQSYFNDRSVDRARTKFRVRTEMLNLTSSHSGPVNVIALHCTVHR